jgi:hypothetical protein
LTRKAPSKTPKTIVFFITLFMIFLTAAKFLFDENPSNDHFGWLALVMIWTLRGGYDFFEYRQKGHKKTALFHVLLAVAGLGLILWQTTSLVIQ